MGTANHACRFTLKADHFDLDLLVHSHGWIRLVPFSWDDEQKILSRHETVDGKIVYLSVKQVSSGASVTCTSKSILRPSDRKILRRRASYMLGLDIDIDPFVKLARSLNRRVHRFAHRGGARILRSSTLYEDVVKTLFTTNASWAFTKQMCQRLVSECASSYGETDYGTVFPTPEMVSPLDLSTLTKKCRLGYRAEYLQNVTTAFIDGGDSLERGFPAEVVKRLSEVKGLGPYCVNHIAMLLGEYSQIPVDSEVRSYCKEIGLSHKEEMILEHYYPWHPYEFLAFRIDRRLGPGHD